MLAESVAEEIIFGLENLGLSRAAVRERLEANLARFGLGPLRSRAPRTLSRGEQQKLALAAMMAREPAVLVLDEPLSTLGHMGKFVVKWGSSVGTGVPVGFVALGLARALLG